MIVLVTGSSGLIGSEAVRYFDHRGARVYGIDNNMRADFFGPPGDTTWNLEQLKASCQRFEHCALDIRDRQAVLTILEETKPDLLIHCAAQPSHDLASSRPFDDFDVNAVGTLNLLEATRRHAPEALGHAHQGDVERFIAAVAGTNAELRRRLARPLAAGVANGRGENLAEREPRPSLRDAGRGRRGDLRLRGTPGGLLVGEPGGLAGDDKARGGDDTTDQDQCCAPAPHIARVADWRQAG